MADKLPQIYANHTRFHPPFHYFLAPGALVLIVLTVVNVFRHYSQLDAWILLLTAILFFAAVFLVRSYPLKAQDRIIRLEERLRLQTVLSGALARRIPELTEAQLIACREGAGSEDAGARNQEGHRGMACRYISRVKPPHCFEVFRHDTSEARLRGRPASAP